ncbi:MAG: DMT family transporter [Dysosmobacter sp.]
MNERNQAVALMLFSALSFSLMQAVVKLSATHIGTMEQVFCRNLISMAISFVLLRRSHLPLLGGRKYQPALLARSFFGFIGVVMLFYATAGARQADIAVLNRTSPIWVSLFALLILRERISKVQIPVILLCLAGAVAAMRPSFDSNTLPLVLALLTAVSSGLAYTMIAFCRGQVAPMTVIFHFSLFSTIAAGFLMIPSFVVPTPRDLIMLMLIGIFGAGGQIGLTYAYQKAPAAE